MDLFIAALHDDYFQVLSLALLYVLWLIVCNKMFSHLVNVA